MRKYIIMIAAAALTLSSCNKILTLEPESQLTADKYFRTEEDLQLFSNTFYNNLLDQTPFQDESDVFITKNPNNCIRGGFDWTVPATGGSWSWTNLRKMNTLLGNINNCKDAKAVKEYTALTKFWRAYFYYEKVMKFGDVPWIDRELGSDDEALYAPRDSRETVLQHMLADIDEAIANLPGKAAAPQTAYRVNKYTAMHLKAQICLFEGTFRKYHTAPAPFADSYKAADGSTHTAEEYLALAADAAKKLIESKQYKLYSTGNTAADYVNLFKADNVNTDEVILGVNYDRDLIIKHDCGRFLTNQTASTPGMTKKMVDMYLMKDGTRFTDQADWKTKPFAAEVADRDPRLAQTIRTPGYSWGTVNCGPELKYCMTGYQIIKYIPAYETKPYSTDNCFNDMPVYRYAETLLIYAEALAELGTLTQGDLDISLNLLRKRAGMPDLDMAAANANPDPYMTDAETGFTNVTGANAGVILEIRRERAVELFCEGWGRYFDLIRWKAGYCINQPMYGMYIPGPGDYSFGDKSNYTFYTGTTSSKLEKYRVFDPAETPDSGVNYTYLIDPTVPASATPTYATAGVIDVMHTLPHVFDESKHYFFPIPANEILLNSNLKQNPQW